MKQKANDQGIIINEIETHVVAANKNVVKAELEIEVAETYEKKSRKKLIIFIIIGILVALVAIGLGIYFGVFYNRNKKTNP